MSFKNTWAKQSNHPSNFRPSASYSQDYKQVSECIYKTTKASVVILVCMADELTIDEQQESIKTVFLTARKLAKLIKLILLVLLKFCLRKCKLSTKMKLTRRN